MPRRPARRSVLRLEALDDRITPAAGGLDQSFGTAGIVTTSMGPGNDYAFRVKIDGNGKVVVGGYGGNGSNTDFALARYNSNGTLDASFGTGGKVTTPIGSGDDGIYDLVFDSSHRIIAGGYAYNGSNFDFALARFNPNGTLDNSFGTGGIVTTSMGASDDYVRSIALDSTGRIVVAGWSSNVGGDWDFTLARYNSNGSLDNSFGSAGKVITSLSSGPDMINSMVIDPSGRIVVAGQYDDGTKYDFALARYNVNGSFDPTFGFGGTVGTTNSAHGSGIQSLAIDGSGRLVVGGWEYPGSSDDLALARYNATGALDGSFGSGGLVSTPIGLSYDTIQSLQLDSSGRIVVGGYTSNGANYDFVVARYNSTGSLDGSFGSSGVVTTSIGAGDDQVESLAIDSNGQIVVAGRSNNGSTFDFAVARYYGSPVTIISGPGTRTFIEGSAPLTVDNMLALTNSPNADLVGATVQIGNYFRNQDVLGYTLQGGITASFDSLTGKLTFSGSATLANYQAVLQSLTYTNSSQSPNELDRTITILVDDGEPSQNLASASYTIHVVAVNNAPTFTADGELAPILATNPSPPGQTIFAIFKNEFQDLDIGDYMSGIAVVGNTASPATEGAWQYSTDSGGTWFDVGVVADDATALALSASTRIRFLPAAGFSGQPTPLTVRAMDSTFPGSFTSGATRQTVNSSVNGGTTPLAATTSAIDTQVFPVGTGGNTPPSLFGVPVSATLNELATLSFTAMATDPDIGQALAFSLVGAPTGASINPDSGAFTWTPTEGQGPNTFVFLVRVTDGFANTDQAVTVFVREVNRPPSLGTLPTGLVTAPGSTIAFTATATDPDLTDGDPETLTYSLVGAPLGAFIDPDTGAFSFTPGDSNLLGNYTFKVRVADDGTPSLSDSKTMTISVKAAALVIGDLLIGGTAGNDNISVNPSKDKSQLVVTMNKVVVGNFPLAAVTGKIVVHGLSGNDSISVSSKVTKTAWLFGDGGNDKLTGGGGGNNLLVGGGGNDTLTAKTGTNVLIGGSGAAKLNGGTGDDLLIGGSTNFDTNMTALANIFAEWTSGSTYANRVAHLSGTAGGVNNGTFLTAATMQDNGLKDVLTGKKGNNWYIVGALDKTDAKPGEIVTTI